VVGIVLVSHSAALAEAVRALAREMGGSEVALEVAGGLEDDPKALGTDASLVGGAIERAGSGDGVLVLMDLGSAVMSAELAVEMREDAGERVLLCEAPLVEGAVAAAAAARAGGSLDDVAREARAGLRMKAGHLGVDEEEPAPAVEEAPTGGPELRLRVENPTGLHARPAARFVETASRYDAEVSVVNETAGRGPASGRSLTALGTLGVRQGQEVRVTASGPDAEEALRAIEELARAGFGDTGAPAAGPAAREPVGPPDAGDAGATAPPASGASLRGAGAARGIALGEARRLEVVEVRPPERREDDPQAEWRLLEGAIAATHADVERERDALAARAGEEAAGILGAHLLMLDDSALLEPAREAVFDQGRSAGDAWMAAAERAAAQYRALDDEYQRERAADVLDVSRRVVGHLAGEGAQAVALAGPGILIAGELTPGQAAGLDRRLVLGIATAHGGPTSHAAILSRSLGIPAIVGVGESVLAIEEGTPLALDGEAGVLHVDPSPELTAEYERRRDAAERRRSEARARAREPAATRDGRRVEVMANLGSPGETEAAIEAGAEGVGLLRTEFLFLDRDELPGEDEQAAAYTEIAAALGGRPLVVRTLDVGADKPLPSLPQEPEENPFLGRRGIRLALAEPEVLRTQARAIVRAAADHPVKVMFPMVATLSEYRAARAVVDEAAAELGRPPGLEVGVMVEVPSLALEAERFAREVDFFSIGTNDLAQYTLAAGRGDERLAELTAGPVPALLRLIRLVADAGAAGGRWVGVCGELAGDPAAAVLLVGLGVTELSMAPASIPEVKQALRGVELRAARELAEAALELESADQVLARAAEAGVPAGEGSAHAARA
jgi:multiphosphoryl transfer protein